MDTNARNLGNIECMTRALKLLQFWPREGMVLSLSIGGAKVASPELQGLEGFCISDRQGAVWCS